jgi:hypothetical protein
MNVSHPRRMAARRDPTSHRTVPPRRIRSRVGAGGLLLAAITAAIGATQPAAFASPSAPASASQPGQAAGEQASASSTTGQISWSVTPASATGPDSRVAFTYANVKPGSTISDHVAVTNRSHQIVSFTLYATDATGTTARNGLILLPAAKRPVDIGSWASFPRHGARLSVIIPARTGLVEAFTLAVPQNAAPGDHTGGMIASVAFERKNALGQVVTLDERVADPIELRVAGPLHAALRVESISAGFNSTLNPFGDGSATVSYTIANTGNVRLTGSQVVSVTGPFGIASNVAATSLPVVLNGDSVRLTVRAAGLYPAGPLTAHVHVSPANPAGAGPIPEPVVATSGSASLFAVPWGLIGLVVLLVAVGVGGWQAWRWRRRRLALALVAVAESARAETEKRLQGGSADPAGPAEEKTSKK